MDQLIIMLTGVVAIWLLNEPRDHIYRWGCIVGLIGQPAWLWATWHGQQWGMLAVTVGFTLAYLRGLWTLWLWPRIDAIGMLINPHAWWIGAHYSPANRRLCVNPLPCVTLWLVRTGGKTPDRAKL